MTSPRHWQFQDPDGLWQDVADLSLVCLLLADGRAFTWHEDGRPLPLGAMMRRLRYTVPVHGQLMAWRVAGRSGLAILARDVGREGLAEEIRQAQAEERQRHGRVG
jgi:hypothetical protein